MITRTMMHQRNEESSPREDSSVSLTHYDPSYLGLICLIKKGKICFRSLSDSRIQSYIFLKKRTLCGHVKCVDGHVNMLVMN